MATLRQRLAAAEKLVQKDPRGKLGIDEALRRVTKLDNDMKARRRKRAGRNASKKLRGM